MTDDDDDLQKRASVLGWLTIREFFRHASSFFWKVLALAKLRKATIRFVMSVRLSVRMEQLCSNWKDFHEISYLRIFFWKICRENSTYIKI